MTWWTRLVDGRAAEPSGARAAVDGLVLLSDGEIAARVQAVLREAGYSVVDFGRDELASADWILRRRGERTLLRLAHWRERRVRSRDVRALYEQMQDDGASGCTLMTCGAIDSAAHEFARGKPIELIDAARLIEVYPNIVLPALPRTPKLEESYTPPPQAEADLVEEARGGVPLCPRCRSVMLLRRAGADAGDAAGVAYWACPQFPRCPGTRPA